MTIRVATAVLSERIFAGRPTKDGRGFKEPRFDVTSDVLVAIRDKVGIGNEITVECDGKPQYRIAVLPIEGFRPAPAQVEQWWPIVTCGATGQAEAVIVAVTCPDREPIVGEAWRAEDGEWWWAGTAPGEYHDDPISECNFGEVTHWMPMPDAPGAIRSGGAS